MSAHAPLLTPCPSARPVAGRLTVSCALLSLVLGGCSTFDNATNRLATVISPYRMEVVQGNFVSKEQVEALKPGMTRNQVRDVLGTPLLASVFHSNRWDYVFTLHRQGIVNQSRHLSVFFKGDVLERFEGDTMPSEAEFVATLESDRKLGKVPNLQADPASLLKFAPAGPPAARATAPAAESPSYPPLEAPQR